MKQLKICISKDKRDKVISDINGKYQTIQDFMTIKALEILQIKSEVKTPPEKRDSLQFRLDSTIYKLVEQKAKLLNKNISELFDEVL